MWIDLSLFGFALAGITVLLSLKALELKGSVGLPLGSLRRSCDHLVERGWATYLEHVRERGIQLVRYSYRLVLRKLHEFYARTLAFLHVAVMRLHMHLSRRRAMVSKSREKVSPHLKGMLEYKEKAKEESSAEVPHIKEE